MELELTPEEIAAVKEFETWVNYSRIMSDNFSVQWHTTTGVVRALRSALRKHAENLKQLHTTLKEIEAKIR